ncbi:BlaI/MecI/CopY family transcriptional regulator [Dactylosporangium sp. CA-139114]|uniref:BlaI/MecI/CopY family transcriptional regulator n=1 Tax=Dactylosporangium sp. CA-139114 TaxID=3239931 RepID=UPI003D973127
MASGRDGARRAAGRLEAEVLGALWAAGRPCTPGEVHAALGAQSGYTTVQTILARLFDKNLVRRRTEGRAHAYWPVKDGAELTADRMRALLSERADRRQVLQRFVRGLDDDEAAALRALLDEEGRRP